MIGFKDFISSDRVPEASEFSTQTDEALDFAQRRQRARIMKKYKAKIAMGRKKAQRRTADTSRLTKRARKQAINQMFLKLSKGTSRTELPPSRRTEIEKRIEKMKPRIDKIARKLLPKVRKMERERRSPK